MFTEEIAVELERISLLDDMFQQGYQAAPLLCQVNEISPARLVSVILEHPSECYDSQQRDAGVLQWCKEQLEKAL